MAKLPGAWTVLERKHEAHCGAYLVSVYDRSARFRINKIRGDIVTLSRILFDAAPAARPT